jgi:MFS superfamily sulfate permease-like transporter
MRPDVDPHRLAPAQLALLGTASLIFLLRWRLPRWPGARLSLGVDTGVTVTIGLHEAGLKTIADLLPVAMAVTLLFLVESSSVAPSIAARSGQRLDLSAEFTGEGFANLCAAFMGGYPTTGSLSRSTSARAPLRASRACSRVSLCY